MKLACLDIYPTITTMTINLATPDTALASIQAALPIDPQPYTLGDRLIT